jgi:hypothetical protein
MLRTFDPSDTKAGWFGFNCSCDRAIEEVCVHTTCHPHIRVPKQFLDDHLPRGSFQGEASGFAFERALIGFMPHKRALPRACGRVNYGS